MDRVEKLTGYGFAAAFAGIAASTIAVAFGHAWAFIPEGLFICGFLSSGAVLLTKPDKEKRDPSLGSPRYIGPEGDPTLDDSKL